MIKVGITGTHGAGKTTVCHELIVGLKKRDVNAEYLGEVAREARQKGFKLNEETTRGAQDWILYTQIRDEIEIKELRPDVEVLICDRIGLCNYLYRVNKFGYDADLDPIVNRHAKSYDFIFRVPLNGNYLKHDGVRAMDREFQRQIDGLITEELKRRQIPYHDFLGIDSALEMILKRLNESK